MIPAGYPGNPFGVPLLLKKAFWDAIPELDQHEINENKYLEVGVRGNLPHEWQYQSYVRYSSDYHKMSNDMRFSLPALNAAINNPDPNQRLILLHNSQRYRPNSPAAIRALFDATPSTDRPLEWEYAAQADGTLWSLASGPIRTAVAANVRESYTDFTYVPGDSQGSANLQGAYNRRVTEFSGEIRVPIIGAERRWRGAYQLDVHAAMRTTADTFYHRREQVPSYGLLYQPASWITFRASRSENYTLPQLSYVVGRTFTVPMWIISLFDEVTDPLRGNKVIDYDFPVRSGAYRDLKAERGHTDSVSFDLAVTGIKNLQLSVNYADTKTLDGIYSPFSGSDYRDVMLYFPERVTRAPRTPADIAAGWAGQITSLDARHLNVASSRSSSVDIRAQYRLRFHQSHRLSLSFDEVVPIEYSEQLLASSPLIDRVGEMPVRCSFRANWEKDPYAFGFAWIRTAKIRYDSGIPGEEVIGANNQFDFSASYDFGNDSVSSGWARCLSNLKVSARVINAFPSEPRFRVSNGVLLGRESALSRQYQIDVRKSF